MTQDLLADLPPIAAPEDKHQPAPVLTPIAAMMQRHTDTAELAKVDLKAVALAQFGDWRGAVADARKTLDGVVHDVSTAAKLADAVALRNRLIRTPRAEVRKVSKAVKSRLAAVSKDVGAEEDAAVLAWDGVETLITPQIEAGDAKLEADRLEKERLATERAQKIADELATITVFLERAKAAEDMTAERVGNGIGMLDALTFGAEDWTDPVAAASAQQQTITGMRELQAKLAAEEAAAAQMAALREANERMAAQLAAQQAALDAQAAALRNEQARMKGLQARIAEIHAAATGHENATAADLYEAMVAVTALDVSEAQYQEYTALAMAAQDATLATLQGLHFSAVEREEEIEAARQRASTPAANVATAAATEGMAENPEPGALEAAPIASQASTQVSQSQQDDAAGGARRFATFVYRTGTAKPAAESTEGQAPQQVLKAEPATADATDRDVPADTSPRAGAMGEWQAAGAAPAAGPEPTMTLGAINTYIAPLKIDGAGLELLGFPVVARVKGAMLYRDTDRTAMVAAMVKHLQGL